ncbi:electron transport complex, RnfABCDGE type, D subunit [Alkalilimnicola ehrlichii MLHE-1]|uniref:Ion-translocating oxidoreductase complex subunit D n=1 Tax=Alkalilimnicola ehrlichii (strain ATCC BAA-1101 / DSM 17681 / MLHE-1) TaxID=187272 RepID=Q0AAH0_ALKEH|nr:electron transport complex, RnfABCDGE type, D subunit [Alkalilimnicola ehrlichii MLHE-1]
MAAIMRQVLYALVPGTLALAWFQGVGVFVHLAVALVTAVAVEAAVQWLRRRPATAALSDHSVLVTGWILALAVPPLAPWWVTASATLFAVLFGKHLYGGLGFNPFNPAMVGYVMALIAFPREMTFWFPAAAPGDWPVGAWEAVRGVLVGLDAPTLDALTGATPLDLLHTGAPPGGALAVESGPGWMVAPLLFLAGGLWLLRCRLIDFRIPAGMLGAMALLATLLWLLPGEQPDPLFHLLAGGTLLGAFFVATDPVSAATTARGRWVYGAGIGALALLIREFGGYPDGVAFAVLLMNGAAPFIDYCFRPRRATG